MYLSFYDLNEKPFELVPNPHYLYMSNTHRRAMNYLQYGFEERAGFILLTGEIGAGKTTLLRELINRLDEHAIIARVFNTQIEPAQLLGLINMDFGLDVSTLDKVTLLKDLNRFLIDCYARGEKPLLIIDEAQNLSLETLEEIRLLSNLESADEKLLQIIMVGQPELQTNLDRSELKQLRQRLSVSCHLGALSLEETQAYFCHRLECAGNRDAVSMPEKVFAEVHAACHGLPRLINIFGDYLLLAAYSDRRKRLSMSFVREVLKEIRNSVAFSDQAEAEEGKKVPSRRGQQQEILEALRQVRERQKEHERLLQKITRKQVLQIDTIQDQFDAICSSIHTIEEQLRTLVAPESRAQKEARNAFKQVAGTPPS